MESSTQFGANRTGIQSSPQQTKELLKATKAASPTSAGDESALASVRLAYIRESEPLGTVPPSADKRAAGAAAKSAPGVRQQVLVDRLAERMAFERAGTRLYEALIVKHAAYADQLSSVSADRLQQFHAEEAEHFRLLAECLQTLGADPTAQTPGADLVGVQGIGLMQAITEPRTTFVQALNAILVAELADNDGWQTLIGLTRQAGLDEMADRFTAALEQEDEHLAQVRAWMTVLTSTELGGQSSPMQLA